MVDLLPSVALEHATSGTTLKKRVRQRRWRVWTMLPKSRTRHRFYWIDVDGENKSLRWRSQKKHTDGANIPICSVTEIQSVRVKRKSFVVLYGENNKLKLRAKSAAQMRLWVLALQSVKLPVKPPPKQDVREHFECWIRELDAEKYGSRPRLSAPKLTEADSMLAADTLEEAHQDDCASESKSTRTMAILRATTPQPIVDLFLSLVDSEVRCSCATGQCACRESLVRCSCATGQCACRESLVPEDQLLSLTRYAELQEISLSEARDHVAECGEGGDSMSLGTFSMLMQSWKNSIFNLGHDDMSRPLSEYLIATSHNTYLEGDQLKGDSTVKQYIDVLTRRRCRCIEIDVWDGDTGPIVTHGHTMCGKIHFEEVIRAVIQFGFMCSPYPIVLSIEQHCTKYIKRQGQILLEVLGDALVQFDDSIRYCVSLPSPAALMHRVLVKAKVQKVDTFDRCVVLRTSKLACMDVLHLVSAVKEDDSGASWPRRAYNIASYSETKMITFMKKALEFEPEESYEYTSANWVTRCFRALYHGAGLAPKKRGFLRTSKRFEPVREAPTYSGALKRNTISSTRFSQHEVSLLRTYHTYFLSRIFPKPTRVCSTNFDPSIAWNAGCQMAAMNYQTLDDPMILNEGLFRHTNCGAGYVLKHVPARKEFTKLTVEIVCGSFLAPFHRKPLSVKCSLSNSLVADNSFVTDALLQPTTSCSTPTWRHVHVFDIDPQWWTECHHILTFEVFHHEGSLGKRILFSGIPLRCLALGTLRWVDLYDSDFEKHRRSGLCVSLHGLDGVI